MRRRVVITGAGAITPLGVDLPDLWESLAEGRSGIGFITQFDASSFPVRIAAEVRDWDLSDVGEDPEAWKSHARETLFAVGAAIKAVRMAELDHRINPRRFGVYLGCGETFPDFQQFGQLLSHAFEGEEFELDRFLDGAQDAARKPATERGNGANAGRLAAYLRGRHDPDMIPAYLAGLFDAQGPNANCIAACASSTQAVGEAAQIIRRGEADLMLCGGAHSMIHPFGLTGFLRLSTLSLRNDDPQRAMRPFDHDRDGFVIGEGGAIFVLEELEHAKRRGVEILAELTGYGSAQDAYRVSDPHPEGRGSLASIREALAEARLNPDDVDYVNAHGTSTVLNDKVETRVMKQVFGRRAATIPISSTKSMLGHFATASGAIELAACLMALRTGVIHPTINYETPDPECDLDYVPNTARELRCRHALNNSLGFGGQNAALVLSRYGDGGQGACA